jgi:hypothetical protein
MVSICRWLTEGGSNLIGIVTNVRAVENGDTRVFNPGSMSGGQDGHIARDCSETVERERVVKWYATPQSSCNSY